MPDTPKTSFSVSCAKCGNQHQGDAETAFLYLAAARASGWVVPDALENKPILCPTCKTK